MEGLAIMMWLLLCVADYNARLCYGDDSSALSYSTPTQTNKSKLQLVLHILNKKQLTNYSGLTGSFGNEKASGQAGQWSDHRGSCSREQQRSNRVVGVKRCRYRATSAWIWASASIDTLGETESALTGATSASHWVDRLFERSLRLRRIGSGLGVRVD